MKKLGTKVNVYLEFDSTSNYEFKKKQKLKNTTVDTKSKKVPIFLFYNFYFIFFCTNREFLFFIV